MKTTTRKIDMGMIDYKNLKNLSDIDRERAALRMSLSLKEKRLSSGFIALKEDFTPVNLFAEGVKSVSSYIPLDRIVLFIVRLLKKKLTR